MRLTGGEELTGACLPRLVWPEFGSRTAEPWVEPDLNLGSGFRFSKSGILLNPEPNLGSQFFQKNSKYNKRNLNQIKIESKYY